MSRTGNIAGPPEASASTTTVWIVDDSPLDAERARRVLAASYEVRVFVDGSALLEHLADHRPPDVLVLDWVMPGVTGIEVCRFLRGGTTPQTDMAILLLTMQTEVEQIVEGLKAGANDYLVKPYADPELLARVDALVRWNGLLDRAQKAEASLLDLLEHAPDPLLRIDGRSVITYVNGEAQRALGHAAPALVGQPLAAVLPALAREDLADAFRSARPLPDIEIGDQIYSPTVRSLPSDRSVGSTIGIRNVTDRRRKERRRLDFYSVIAHDLRSPLASLLMRTELLLRGHRGELPKEVAIDLRKMESNMQSLVALINDFLDFARMDEAAARIERAPVNLPELIAETVEDFKTLADGNLQSLRVEPSEPRPHGAAVLGDRRRLKQALANLIANAIKFTPRHGNIDVRTLVLDDALEIAIEDDGPGIASEFLPMLFQRYSRAPHRNREVGGTGLGLLIVREIVEAHGGRVGVDSMSGRGSRFWLRLPALRPDGPTTA